MRRRGRVAGVVLAALTVLAGAWSGSGGGGWSGAAHAGGQQQQGPFTEASLRGGGQGALRLAGRPDEPLKAVDIQLKAGGVAEIRVTGARTYGAKGRWRGRGANTVLLSGLSGDFISQPLRGQGTIRLDGQRRFERLEMDGTIGNRRFSVQFARAAGTALAPFRELRARNTGQGTLVVGKRAAEPLSGMTVTLTEDGVMQVEARTPGNDVRSFTGRWTPVSVTAASLDVTGGLGTAGARGTGTMTLLTSGSGLARVELRGETQNEPFTLRFVADSAKRQP